MKYIKLTLQYMYHNIWFLLLFSLVPALLLGLFTDPSNSSTFIKSFKSLESFSDVFRSMSDLNLRNFLISLAGIPLILVFFSAAAGIISKHMRLGVFSMSKFFRRVNNNILYALVVLIALLIAFELHALFGASFSFLYIRIFNNGRAALALSIVTIIFLWLLLLTIIAICMLWLPTMSVTGLNPWKALAESFKMSRGNLFKIFLAVALPLIPYFAIAAPLSYFRVPAREIVFVLLHLIYLPYYLTLMYTIYCDVNDIDREDLRLAKFKKSGIIYDNDDVTGGDALTRGDNYDA